MRTQDYAVTSNINFRRLSGTILWCMYHAALIVDAKQCRAHLRNLRRAGHI